MDIGRVLFVGSAENKIGVLQNDSGNHRKFSNTTLTSIFGNRINFSKIDAYGMANDGEGGVDNKWFTSGTFGDGFVDTTEIREFIHEKAGSDALFDFSDFKKVFGDGATEADFENFQNFIKVTNHSVDEEFGLDSRNYTVNKDDETKECTILYNEENTGDDNILTYTEFRNGTKIYEQTDEEGRLTSLRNFNSGNGQLDIGYNFDYNAEGKLESITKIAQNTETADTADRVAEHYVFETPIEMPSEEISIDYIKFINQR